MVSHTARLSEVATPSIHLGRTHAIDLVDQRGEEARLVPTRCPQFHSEVVIATDLRGELLQLRHRHAEGLLRDDAVAAHTVTHLLRADALSFARTRAGVVRELLECLLLQTWIVAWPPSGARISVLVCFFLPRASCYGERIAGGSGLAYSTLALTVTLAVSRPRLGLCGLRFSPGTATLVGVAVLLLAGSSPRRHDLVGRIQWRPLLALTCIMVMTGVVREVGAFDRLALRIEAYARRTSPSRAFTLVFAISVVTPSLLNNDSAILLLTPLVIALTRRLYPGRADLTEAFAFAVFLAPGVAPFVISNPMNMIVAEFAGVGFNAYARVMVPISLAGALLTYVVLRRHFRALLVRQSRRAPRAHRPAASRRAPGGVPAARSVRGVPGDGRPRRPDLGRLARRSARLPRARMAIPRRAREEAGRPLFPDILVFLWGVFLVVAGLRHVGVVDGLAISTHRARRDRHEVGVIGGIGRARLGDRDNHPMSILNMMALGTHESSRPLLAALVGGDIGPRLLPIGSLAGLLWMDLPSPVRRRIGDRQVHPARHVGALAHALGLARVALAPRLAQVCPRRHRPLVRSSLHRAE